MDELRQAAANRDQKRDIAALTMNMAISRAREDAFDIDAGPACLQCGARVGIGDLTADCPVCHASWPVVAVTDKPDPELYVYADQGWMRRGPAADQ